MDAQLCADRRVLLEYVLKDFVKRGGNLVLPRSTPFNDPPFLDSLDVLGVLRAVSNTGSPLDLVRLSSNPQLANGKPPKPASRITPTGFSPEGIPTYGGVSSVKLESGYSAKASNNPFDSSPDISNHDLSETANPFLRPSKDKSSGGGGGAQTSGGSGAASRAPAHHAQHAQHAHHGQHVQQAQHAQKAQHARTASAPTYAAALGTDATADSAEDAGVATSLELPLLEIGVADDHLRELTYFIFASACPSSPGPQPTAKRVSGSGGGSGGGAGGPAGGDSTSVMLTALRGQLELDESVARDVASVMRHVSTGYWTAVRRCSMEGLMNVLAMARANDFNMLGGVGRGFKGWVRWRGTLGRVLGAAADLKHAALQSSAESKRLVARLRGALRRMDVRTADEFDEEEYAEAAAALKDATRGLAFCGLRKTAGGAPNGEAHAPSAATSAAGPNGWTTFESPPPKPGATLVSLNSTSLDAVSSGAGWKLPWALRARVAELLLASLFDTINEGSYIDEMAAVHGALEAHVWPALGVSPTLALALSAWVHFRQYIATGHAWLARQLKVLISKLSTSVTMVRSQSLSQRSTPAIARPALVSPLTAEDEAEADSQVAAEVGRLVVERLLDRLSDYHLHYPPGTEQSFQVLLDTTASAARARGDSEAQLAAMLLEVVAQAVSSQWRRLCEQRQDIRDPPEQTLLLSLVFAEEVFKAESSSYSALLQPYLPYQQAVVAATLHRAAGQNLLPWMRNGLGLDPDSVSVVRAAIMLDKQLGGCVAEAQAAMLYKGENVPRYPGTPPGTAAAVVADALRGFMCWELDVPVQLAMDKWVGRRVESMGTWVDRQLATEKWVAVNTNDGYAQSAREVIVLVTEAMEALFGMQLPVGQSALSALLSGINLAMGKYAQHILGRMGSPARLIPPMPSVTRYKKPFATKQEEVEAELLALSTPGLQRVKSKTGMKAIKEFGRSFMSSAKPGAPEEGKAFLESVPPIQSQPDYSVMQGSTPAVISCYIMSAHYLSQKLDGVATALRQRWVPHPVGSDNGWIPGAFQGCKHQLQQVCQAACVFLATKVVFWDMRYGWLEQLYRHHVPSKSGSAMQPPYSCRIDPLLNTLNESLTEACGSLPDSLRAMVAMELLTAAATAWQRVLLDGGPCRWFIPADVPALHEDLDSLQHLFEVDGEGLDRGVIEPVLRPCRRLLLLVGCNLAQLMSMLRTARIQGRATLQMVGREPEVFDEYQLMRALARRPDRTGSKLLKKEYKMGRRLKT